MKNKESRDNKSFTRSVNSKTQKDKENNNNKSQRGNTREPTLSQINRLKRFYNTTRWLPNSSFTTFFGKPAFENYGYGNTNPVYGGLFYGNYMLTHNINPVDGENLPEYKQVYASSMLKASKNHKTRVPEPPRKVPDEIRNTPDELKEIKGRNPIFQKENNFPNREIHKPNLIKAKYFRSPKGSQKGDNNSNLNEEFDIEGLLDGRGEFKKKRKILNKKANAGEEAFFQKELKKKIIKEQVDNKNPEYLKSLKKEKEKEIKLEDENEVENNEGVEYNEDEAPENQINEREMKEMNPEMLKLKMKQFYEKMLEEKLEKGKENEEREEKANPNFNNQSSMINAQQTTQAPDVSTSFPGFIQGESFRQRIIKKENPCLIPANELK